VPSQALKRFALPVSVLLIVAYWAFSVWAQLFRAGGGAVPGSVDAIVVLVCVKTALAVAVEWALLDAGSNTLLAGSVSRSPWLIDSAIFGLGHLYQGVTAAVQSGTPASCSR